MLDDRSGAQGLAPRARVEGRDVRVQYKGRAAKAVRLGLAMFLVGITALFLGAALADVPGDLFIVPSAIAPFIALIGWANGLFRYRAAEAMSVEGEELVLERRRGRKAVPLRQLAEGWWNPRRGQVELRTTEGDVYSARVRSAEEGQALLEAAGLDASRRTMRLRLGETTFLDALVWILGPFVALLATDLILEVAEPLRVFAVHIFVGIFVGLLQGVRQLFGPAELLIGADGVTVRQRFRRRFVPFARIAEVTAETNRVELHLAGGGRVRAKARHLTEAERELLQARIADALQVGRGGAEPAALAQLDRGGRSGEAWRLALGALLAKDGDYRGARLTREQVAGVLENPAAPVERRLGAAMALAAARDAEGRARVRIAAEASANAEVRAALARIAEGELAAGEIEDAIAAERRGAR